MNFTLDVDKTSMLMIAGHVWTYDEPGPIEIDVQKLNPLELKQIIINCARRHLVCDQAEELQKLVNGITNPGPSVIQNSAEKRTSLMKEAEKKLANEIKSLKKLLKGKIPSIRKVLPTLGIRSLQKLKELETEGKARKSVIDEIDAVLKAHTDRVTSTVGNEDTGGKFFAPGMKGVGSGQVTDIVESEVKKVIFNPLEE